MLKNWGVSSLDPEFRPISSRESYDDLLTMQSGQRDAVWEIGGRGSTAQPDTGCKRIEILLDKDPKGEGFGFVLRGGAYSDSAVHLPLTVTKIIPGSPADREGTLQVGDRILEINGGDMSQFTVQQAANVLNDADNDVTLLIEYDVIVLDWISHAAGPVVVEIEKPAGKVLDITLSSTTWNGLDVIYIDSVYEAGIADRSGSLHVGDHVNAIDGLSIEGKGISQATSLLKANVTDRIQLEIFPVSAQLTAQTRVEHLLQDDSPALSLYDNIGRSNNQALRGELVTTTSDDLNNYSYNHPNSLHHQQQQHHYHPFTTTHRGHFRVPPPSYSTLNLSSMRGGGAGGGAPTPPFQTSSARSATPPNSFQMRNLFGVTPNGTHHHSSTIRNVTPPSSGLSTRSATPPAPFRARRIISGSTGVLHGFTVPGRSVGASPPGERSTQRRSQKAVMDNVDVTEVVLFAKENGFGIEIETLRSDDGSVCAVVTHLEPSGEAARCGLIQEGDRVIALNGRSIKGKTSEDIQQMIAFCSPGILRILYEFNVADSIVVNSGTIHVKLLNSGIGLGMTFSNPDNRQNGDPLFISEIRKGSVSHRVGALSVGDALLMIDDNDVTNCSVDHVTQMLDGCFEVIQFTFRKKESSSIKEPSPASNFVTFSVELPLPFGGHLGISLSEEDRRRGGGPSFPTIITIADIADTSIAQLTSALRVGDEVLSINGINLSDKHLTDAQDLLLNSIDSVCFKIKRYTHKSLGSDCVRQKAQNSVDSAVDCSDASSSPNCDSPAGTVINSAPIVQPCSVQSSSIQASSVQSSNVQPSTQSSSVQSSSAQSSVQSPSDQSSSVQSPSAQSSSVQSSSVRSSVRPFSAQSSSVQSSSVQPSSAQSSSVLSSSVQSPSAQSSSVQSSSAQSSSSHQNLSFRREPQPQMSNEVKVQAEVHHSPGRRMLWSSPGHAEGQATTSVVGSRQPLPVSPVPVPVLSSSLSVIEDEDEWSCKVDALDELPGSGSMDPLTGSYSRLDPFRSNEQQSRSCVTSRSVAHDVTDLPVENGGKTAEAGVVALSESANNFENVSSDVVQQRFFSSKEMVDFQAIHSHHQRDSGYPEVELCKTIPEGPQELERSSRSKVNDAGDGDDASSKAKELCQLEELLESIFTPTPVELLRVVLYKLRINDDFGFSLSDGVYEKGVYVSGVRPEGPASEGLLPFDKILQVNKVKTRDLDCHQVVPIIAQSGNCVELIVCRNALTSSLPQGRSRTARNSISSESPDTQSLPPGSSSTSNQDSQMSDQLWKPRCKRRVNFFAKNTVF